MLTASTVSGVTNWASNCRKACSCAALRPAPPYSTGQLIAPYPASNFVRCQARAASTWARSSSADVSRNSETRSDPSPHRSRVRGGFGSAFAASQERARSTNEGIDGSLMYCPVLLADLPAQQLADDALRQRLRGDLDVTWFP